MVRADRLDAASRALRRGCDFAVVGGAVGWGVAGWARTRRIASTLALVVCSVASVMAVWRMRREGAADSSGGAPAGGGRRGGGGVPARCALSGRGRFPPRRSTPVGRWSVAGPPRARGHRRAYVRGEGVDGWGADGHERGVVGQAFLPAAWRRAGTGITHLGAREYDPALGRFISVGPVMDLADPQANARVCLLAQQSGRETAADIAGLRLVAVDPLNQLLPAAAGLAGPGSSASVQMFEKDGYIGSIGGLRAGESRRGGVDFRLMERTPFGVLRGQCRQLILR